MYFFYSLFCVILLSRSRGCFFVFFVARFPMVKYKHYLFLGFFQRTAFLQVVFFAVFAFVFLNVNVNFGSDSKTVNGFLIEAEAQAEGIGGTLKTASANNSFAYDYIIAPVLHGVLKLFSWFATAAGALLGWVLTPETFTKIMGLESVLLGWQIVRDFFNLGFIFVLLFSAFCTIFQIERYHLKKIIVTLVIMALLVNFSFPIARFIIDVGNVMMYFLYDSLFPAVTSSAKVAERIFSISEIGNIVLPEKIGGSTTASYYLAAIVFTFLLAVTLVTIALLFLVRTVVLVVLVIFSPIGFVALIFPSTARFASDWWGNLFKYSFYGPIMLFMVILAVRIVENMKDIGMTADAVNTASVVTSGVGEMNFIGAMSFFMVPVVILWIGLITALKIGDGASSWVTNKGISFAKGAGRFAMAPVRGLGAGAWRSTGIPLVADKWKKEGVRVPFTKSTRFFGSQATEDRAERMAGLLTGRAGSKLQNRRDVIAQQENRKVAEEAKGYRDKNIDDETLRGNLNDVSAGPIAQRASAMVLAERGAFQTVDELVNAFEKIGNDSNTARQIIDKGLDKMIGKLEDSDYQKILQSSSVSNFSDVNKRLEDKVKSARLDLVINAKAAKENRSVTQSDYKDTLGGLNVSDLAKQGKLLESAPNNQNLVGYLNSRFNTGNSADDDARVKFLSNLNENSRSALRRVNVV